MIEIIPPTQPLTGSITLPGSKSITNRALLIAALAEETSTLRGALKSDDTKYMAQALRQLGIEVEEPDATTFVVHGKGGKLTEPTEPLFLGNAGTATRFLTAAVCLVNGTVEITGDERMQTRPIADLVDALRQLGVKIEYLKKDGCPPLKIISNGKLEAKNGKVEVRGNISSQFVSALLMTLPLIEKSPELKIIGELTSKGYVAITNSIVQAFSKDEKYVGTDFTIEPDASSATYFWAAEKILNQKIEIKDAPTSWIQPDADSQDVMQKFPDLLEEINGKGFPDAIPTLAVLAAFGNGTTHFTGIANLRVKECDRISAVATELNKIKAGLAEEDGDDLIIHGDPDLARNGQRAEIETYDDHRIAMAFSLVGLKVPGIKIKNPECVSKSFPNYWKTLENLGVELKQ